MIRLYDWTEREYLGVLLSAADVCLERKVNGECVLTLSLPAEDELWSVLREECVLELEEQHYRIKNITGKEVTAYPVYQDACGKHIPYTEDMIGVTVREVLETLFADSGVNIMEKERLEQIGLESLETEVIDFFEQSKITPIGGLKTLQEQLQKLGIHSELYFDNKSIALVKALGKDRGAEIDLRYNAKEITVTRDSSEMVTRLYPYGAGGFSVETATVTVDGVKREYGCTYIESENLHRFPVYEGYMSFDDIDDTWDEESGEAKPADRLLEAARRQFAADNPERIDIPKYSIAISMMANAERIPIHLGDIVEVYDPQYQLRTKQRVVEENYYPFETNRCSITVGSPATSVSEMLGGVIVQTQSITNNNGEVKTGSLSPGVINTGRIKIMDTERSGEESLCISQKMMELKDGEGIVRLQMGSDGMGAYRFRMYDASGAETMLLDDDGNVTMKGTLETGKKENGSCGYIIKGDSIVGRKYDVARKDFVNQGFVVTRNENGSHLALYQDGVEYWHLIGNMEDGKRNIRYCVNDSSGEYDSLVAFETEESENCAKTTMYGDWDFSGRHLRVEGKLPVGDRGTEVIPVGDYTMYVRHGLIVDVVRSGA